MRITAIHNELMRSRTLPIYRTNEVDPHCNIISDCCFILINLSPINSKTSQKIRVVESILKHCFLTIPFQHIRLFLWWDDKPLSSSVMYVF